MDANEKKCRLLDAATIALSAAPGRKLNVVVLNKVLFYFDLVSLRDFGSTFTHNSYIGLPQGPVVAKYPKRLVAGLQELGLAKQISEWNGALPIVLIDAPRKSDYMNDDMVTAISKVTKFFSEGTSMDASEYSHQNPGWSIAMRRYLQTGKYQPVDMLIAMQQIVEDDPWMDREDEIDWDAVAEADNLVGDTW